LDRGRGPDRGRWPEGPRDQGRARGHRSRPERGEGPGRRGPEGDQRGRRARRGGQDQSRTRGGGRDGRAQIDGRSAPTRSPVGEPSSGRARLYVIFRGRAPFEVPCPYLRFIYVPLTVRGVADFGTFQRCPRNPQELFPSGEPPRSPASDRYPTSFLRGTDGSE